jgi:integrase
MTQLERYLDSKKNAWSPVTLKNARTMLGAYGASILASTPEEFFESIKELAPYSRKTLFIMATGYWGACNPSLPNVYALYRKANRNVFKNAYQRKALQKSYDEVRAAIEAEEDGPFRRKALQLLTGAQRWSESFTSDGTSIVGKGGKTRADLRLVLRERVAIESISYSAFRRRLAKIASVTPHALRKLALTRAAERGATAADLCEIAGWSSISPAFVYLQPRSAERLRDFLK